MYILEILTSINKKAIKKYSKQKKSCKQSFQALVRLQVSIDTLTTPWNFHPGCNGPLQMLFGVRASWIMTGQQAQTAKSPEKDKRRAGPEFPSRAISSPEIHNTRHALFIQFGV